MHVCTYHRQNHTIVRNNILVENSRHGTVMISDNEYKLENEDDDDELEDDDGCHS